MAISGRTLLVGPVAGVLVRPGDVYDPGEGSPPVVIREDLAGGVVPRRVLPVLHLPSQDDPQREREVTRVRRTRSPAGSTTAIAASSLGRGGGGTSLTSRCKRRSGRLRDAKAIVKAAAPAVGQIRWLDEKRDAKLGHCPCGCCSSVGDGSERGVGRNCSSQGTDELGDDGPWPVDRTAKHSGQRRWQRFDLGPGFPRVQGRGSFPAGAFDPLDPMERSGGAGRRRARSRQLHAQLRTGDVRCLSDLDQAMACGHRPRSADLHAPLVHISVCAPGGDASDRPGQGHLRAPDQRVRWVCCPMGLGPAVLTPARGRTKAASCSSGALGSVRPSVSS